MAGVLNPPLYLLDDEARDASRMTGIPWSMERIETYAPRRPVMYLWNLDWWDRFRVAWALIGGYSYLRVHT